MLKKKNFFKNNHFISLYNNIIKLFYLISIFKEIKADTNNIITNIILVGDKYSKYINFATYSNRDIIIEISTYPGNSKRYFYGLKNDGREFFDNISYDYLLEKYEEDEEEEEEDDDNNEFYRYESEISRLK